MMFLTGTAHGDTPTMPYWHIWTDVDGISHQTRCVLKHFELGSVGNADPQWNDKQRRAAATVVFTVLPA
jgi:hypothetical protein